MLLLCGDVEDHALGEPRLPLLIQDHDGLVVAPDPASVAVAEPVLDLVRRAVLDVPTSSLGHTVVVVGMQAALPVLGMLLPLLGRVAVDLRDLWGHVDRLGQGVRRVDVCGRGDRLDQAAVPSLGLGEAVGGAFPSDGAAQRVRGDAERVDLGGLPIPLSRVIEPDEPPPLAVDGDRRHDAGADSSGLEATPLRLGIAADRPVDHLARREQFLPAREPAVRIAEGRVVLAVVDASARGISPLVRDGHHARTVVRTPVAEHEGPAGVACGTESGEHLVDALGPYGRAEEPLCGEPGRLEDPVASGQRLLRQPALRDVRQHALPRGDPSRSLHEERVVVDPDHAPVGPDDPVVDIEGVSRRVRALGFVEYPLAVVGVQHRMPRGRARSSAVRASTR